MLIAGLFTLVVVLLRRELGRHETYMQKTDGLLKELGTTFTAMAKAQSDKDAALVERYSVLGERLKFTEQTGALTQDRLREGSQAMQAIRESIAAEKDSREKFEREFAERQVKFEQEAHTRQLAFAGQWQTTLVDLTNRFVGQAALDEYRMRHEQDHSRVEVRLSRQEELMEKMEQTVHGIDKKLEGGIQTIAALLAKHVTIGSAKDDCGEPAHGKGGR